MATEVRDAQGNLIAWKLSHTAVEVDNGIDAAGTAEQTVNRVTVVTSGSTDSSYPTAKAVWDAMQSMEAGTEQTANRVTSIGSSASHTTYPSAKAVYDLMQSGAAGAEQRSNRVASISAQSTNTTYPTAKAVWDLFQSITDANDTSY